MSHILTHPRHLGPTVVPLSVQSGRVHTVEEEVQKDVVRDLLLIVRALHRLGVASRAAADGIVCRVGCLPLPKGEERWVNGPIPGWMPVGGTASCIQA